MPIDWKDRVELTKMGVTALTSCLVQTLNESDPTFQKRFVEKLDRSYARLKDSPAGGEPLDCLELLRWVAEALRTGAIAPPA